MDYLGTLDASKTPAQWQQEVHQLVLEELRKSSPTTKFVPGGDPRADYNFEYRISVTAGGEDIEFPSGLVSEYTFFWMLSNLNAVNQCDRVRRSLLHQGPTTDRDLVYTVRRNIAAHGDVGRQIDEHEREHPVPPRGPKLLVTQEGDFVSPLKNEREIDIKITVKDCRGQVVFDRFEGQKVILPRERPRAELTATRGFPQGPGPPGGPHLILKIQRPVGASATYTLKNGMKAEVDPVEIETCGRDRKATTKTEVEIRGLELRVKPEKTEVGVGENTSIEVKLLQVDHRGDKTAVPDERIEVETRGLVDGTVRPSGDVVTNSEGVAILEFSAGKKDEAVRFHAKFEPEGYGERVEDHATVQVIRARPWVRINAVWEHSSQGTVKQGARTGSDNYTERRSASIVLHFNAEPARADSMLFSKIHPELAEALGGDRISYLYEMVGSPSVSATLQGSGSDSHKWDHPAGFNEEEETECNAVAEHADADEPWLALDVDPETNRVLIVGIPTIKVQMKGQCTREGFRKYWHSGYDGRRDPPWGFGHWKTEDLSGSSEIEKTWSIFSNEDDCWEMRMGDGVHSVGGSCTETLHHEGGDGTVMYPRHETTETFKYEWRLYR